MAQQKKFVVKTPRGQIYTQKTSGGTVMAKLEWAGGMAPRIEGIYQKRNVSLTARC